MNGLEERILLLVKDLEEEKRLADKRVKQLYLESGGGAIPIGAIVPYLGGYFTDGNNGGFTMVMASANTIAAVNTLLNPDGFYVCDGAALNLPASPIWDSAGRYLPKLTDDRFIMGDTLGGGVGGNNAMAHTHPFGTLATDTEANHGHGDNFSIGNESSHTHSVTSNVTVAAHGITQPTFTGPSHRHTGPSHLHSTNLPNKVSAGPSPTIYVCTEYLDLRVASQSHVHEHDHAAQNSNYAGTGNTGYSGTGACTRTTSVALSNNHSVGNNAVTSGGGSTHSHGISGGVSAGGSHSHSVNSGATGAASNTENRPKFLGCFYIVRAF